MKATTALSECPVCFSNWDDVRKKMPKTLSETIDVSVGGADPAFYVDYEAKCSACGYWYTYTHEDFRARGIGS